MKKTVATLLLGTLLSSAWAQATPERAEAEVRRIDKDAKKVMLKHGPIDSLAVGDKILFTAEKQQGAYVVTTLEKAK
jgi:Cu/Ag efflux protein CusF